MSEFNSSKTAVKDGPATRSALWSQIIECQLYMDFLKGTTQ
jgi:hypothetical protein